MKDTEDYFMKTPCKHCPFRNDVKPFLHPERAEEIAYVALNRYSSFACHKTTVEDENSEDGEMMRDENSKECAGMLTLRANELGEEEVPEGFKPSYEIVYNDVWEMVDAYSQQNE